MKILFSDLLGKRKEKISDVYEATGISRTTLTNLYYEREQNIQMKTLLKLCDYFQVPLEELVSYEPTKKGESL